MSKKYWFTSDLHLNHKNIIKLCDRPFASVEHMDETIIDNYNKLVSNEDDVYILGDLSFTQSYNNYKKIFSLLKGNKYFCIGNHDNKQALIRCQKEGFLVSVFESKTIQIENDRIFLSHYPFREWNGFYNNAYHLYGHIHGNLQDYCKSTDVGIDMWEYEPVEWKELKEYMKDYENIHPNYML